MKKGAFFALIILSVLVLTGVSCREESPVQTTMATTTSLWVESQGRFYTKDLARAQNQIPFHILLPAYLPGVGNITYSPDIDGPLGQSDNSDITVNIRYGFGGEPGGPKMLIIHESNRKISLGEPTLNPDVDATKILGISVLKASSDTAADFSFSFDDIYYVIETYYLTNNDPDKIVASMISQLVLSSSETAGN